MSIPSNYPRQLDTPVIPIDQGIYETSTTKKTTIGTRLTVGDRVFRYCYAPSAMSAGIIGLGVTAKASNCGGIALIATAATTGASVVSVSVGTAVTLNQYAEGYLQPADNASAGAGLSFRIKSHPVVATNTAGAFTLYDSLPGAVAVQSCNLVPSLYSSVAIGSAAAGIPACVAAVNVPATSYFWGQTWGPASVRAIAANSTVLPITASSGGLSTLAIMSSASGASLPVVGISQIVASAAMCGPVDLKLAP